MSSKDLHGDQPDDGSVGHRKPPRSTRFGKGQSGNPRGRPPGRHREAPYAAVLGQMVTIREDGIEKRVSAAEALLLQTAKKGLAGDGAAARATMAAIEEAHTRQGGLVGSGPSVILKHFVASHVESLEHLGMARRLDPYRPTAHLRLEPWLVEAALARLEDRQLSRAEQTIVVGATRMPKRVTWPKWWVVRS